MSYNISFPDLGIDVTVSRVAFSIGSFNIYWYGILISLGLVLGLVYLFKNAKRFGIDSDKMIDVVIGGMIGAIIGARLYYVLFNWEQYSGDLLSIFSTRGGGMAIYGGIIGAFVAGGLICRWRKIRLLPMFDIAGIGFLIGQAIGRWGNFFNIEAYGGNTTLPWGMTGTKIQYELAQNASELAEIGMTIDPTQPVHPTFLYEFLWCVLGFLALHFYSKHRKFDGEVFLLYLTWYSFGRFWIEGLRTDSLMVGSMRASQILSAALVIGAVALLIYLRRKVKVSNEGDSALYVDSPEWQEYLSITKKSSKQKQSEEIADNSDKAEESAEEADTAQQDETGEDIQTEPDSNPDDSANEAEEDKQGEFENSSLNEEALSGEQEEPVDIEDEAMENEEAIEDEPKD